MVWFIFLVRAALSCIVSTSGFIELAFLRGGALWVYGVSRGPRK